MAIWKDPNGDLHDDMDGAALTLPAWPANQGITLTKLTAEEAAAAQAPTAAQIRAQFVASVLAALDASDMVALRCFKAAVAFPATWQSYVQALRAIVNGTDTTSTTLPAIPAYIPGT